MDNDMNATWRQLCSLWDATT